MKLVCVRDYMHRRDFVAKMIGPNAFVNWSWFHRDVPCKVRGGDTKVLLL